MPSSLNNPLLKSPKKKVAPIPESLVALNGRPVAPILSDEDEYCWVFHPSYGFYFIEGQTNNHYRFFKGDGKGTSHTEVIPNKLYDDCNRGYMFVDRKHKTVQIQTAKLVKDYLDFVPKEVLSGFKKAFPGYDVYLKGCHMASLRQKKALDAVLETMDQEKHPDQSYTTQNGKMMGKGTEVEQGALNDGIPGNLLASRRGKRCIACECGDCIAHIGGGTINDLTNSVVTPKPPIESTIEDATFFKESEDEFEVTRTASGRIVVADTKSYGAGTPNGGTPNGGTPSTPQPSAANPTPPSPAQPNPVPPVQTVNKTPQQLHDEAEGSPTEAGNLTQQQLQQVIQTLKASSAFTEIENFAVGKFAEQIRLAAIPIKPSPTSLPPRDDMRRHIDETAQDEVMEGVRPEPQADAQPQPQAQQPQAQAPAPVAPSAEQELLKQTLASESSKCSHCYHDAPLDDRGMVLGHAYRGMGACPGVGNPPAGRKTAMQTEEGVNKVCPACHGQDVKNLENTSQEDGSLVECLTCGCFFAV